MERRLRSDDLEHVVGPASRADRGDVPPGTVGQHSVGGAELARELELAGFESIAMIGVAPESAAPMITERPTPPQPTTATAEPASTCAVSSTARHRWQRRSRSAPPPCWCLARHADRRGRGHDRSLAEDADAAVGPHVLSRYAVEAGRAVGHRMALRSGVDAQPRPAGRRSAGRSRTARSTTARRGRRERALHPSPTDATSAAPRGRAP